MGYIFFSLAKPFDMDPETLMYFVSFYTGVYCVNISLLAVQFIYRYCAIFSVDYLKYFRGWKSFIWVFYCLFFAVQWLYGVHYMLIPDETTKSYFKQEILDRYSIQDNQVPLRAFMAYDPATGAIRLRNTMFTLNITIIMGVQYGVMIFCGVTMNLKMEARIRNLSSALKKHHKQLFRALVFQITSPTIFLFSPLIMVIYLPFFNIQLSFPAGATVCAFNFYPAMDVIIVMCVVTEYRVAAKKIWISCWKRSGRSEASSRVTHPMTQEAY
ncbi:hypothetical protein GCK72_020479 [Caenorhabditis remanei]|uniref:Uncharacterized protein n=1 Tax=Caenorhabditis remanei TaxID=31234 RepID=A0A6A5GHD8_CAERE|nr:hypothetical protein GCK72_020479 [Caenorhabditis remanei]KAF1753922.1 hypothetical protein GCK72_020479 [Caenorhabditis remanei]